MRTGRDQGTECSNFIVDMPPTNLVSASPLEMEGAAFCSGSRTASRSKGLSCGQARTVRGSAARAPARGPASLPTCLSEPVEFRSSDVHQGRTASLRALLTAASERSATHHPTRRANAFHYEVGPLEVR